MAGSGDPGVRVSDADRDRVLSKLKDGLVDGRLTHDTFTVRAEAALRARFGGDLGGLVADLPVPRQLGQEAVAGYRRALWSTRRRLRGRPPVLRLPRGPQRRFTIGRELECDMTLTDQTVSRWHASLRWDGDGWLLDDLGSTNGTRLNGWRVTIASRVSAGDLVSFGAATFVLADRPR